MKRPRQHRIDTKARRLFEAAVPAEWVVRRLPDDYGVDYEVEVFARDQSTGVVFRVQLKGGEPLTRVQSGAQIALELGIEPAAYLVEEVRVPTVVVAADCASREVWWVAPQLDCQLRGRLQAARRGDRRSLTLHVPTSNRLPGTEHRLLTAVAKAMVVLATQTVVAAEVPRFVELSGVAGPRAEVLKSLGQKVTALRLQEMERLWREGKMEEMANLARSVLEDQSADAEDRFAALLYEEKLLLGQRAVDETRVGTWREERATAERARKLVERGPLDLRLYALVMAKAADLHEATDRDHALFMNWKVHWDQPSDPLWLYALARQRQRAGAHVVRLYGQCHRLLGCAVRWGALNIVPQAVARVVGAMLPFVLRLRHEGLKEALEAYGGGLLSAMQLAADVARELNAPSDEVLTVLHYGVCGWAMGPPFSDQATAWVEKRIEGMPQGPWRRRAQDGLSEFLQDSQRASPGAPEIEVEAQIYRRMAAALGIDLESESDEVAGVVRQGLQDLNPDRVLRHCQHLFASLGPRGMVGEVLRLPTAGVKRLHCTLHGYSAEGYRLDDVYRAFREKLCERCPDESLHLPAWQWTRAWQQGQDRQFAHLVQPTDDQDAGEASGAARE